MNYPDMPNDIDLREIPVVSSPTRIDDFGVPRYTHKENQKVVVPCFIPGEAAHLGEDGHAYVSFFEIASVFQSKELLWKTVCDQASYLINSEDKKAVADEARKLLSSMEWWYCGY